MRDLVAKHWDFDMLPHTVQGKHQRPSPPVWKQPPGPEASVIQTSNPLLPTLLTFGLRPVCKNGGLRPCLGELAQPELPDDHHCHLGLRVRLCSLAAPQEGKVPIHKVGRPAAGSVLSSVGREDIKSINFWTLQT